MEKWRKEKKADVKNYNGAENFTNQYSKFMGTFGGV
jgi:hypothetical protein